jgi:hypothetical protein
MGLRNDREISELPTENTRLGQTTDPISSLNEAWFHTLDRCIIDTPLSEVIFPLMRNCYFGGAMHAVLLLQKGHGDQLASDIAGFIMEEPQS